MNTYYRDFGRGDIQRAWDYCARRSQFGHNVRLVVYPEPTTDQPQQGPAYRVLFSAIKCNPKRAIDVREVPTTS